MMTKFKLPLVAIIAMISTNAALSAINDPVQIDGLTYYLTESTGRAAMVSAPSWVSGKVEVPSIVYYKGRQYTVTSVCSWVISVPLYSTANYAFANCQNITEIILPNTLMSISGRDGKGCFENCVSLKTITIPENVKDFYGSEFRNCVNLKNVVFSGSKIEKLGFHMFSGCSKLENITIPSSIKEIQAEVFAEWSGVKELVIPDNVTKIDFGAFRECSNLKHVTLPLQMEYFRSWDMFRNCLSLEEVTLPEDKQFNCIDEGCFYNCISLKSVDIPDNYSIIGPEAFYNCTSLTGITIPKNISKIVSGAFRQCSNLTAVYYDNSEPIRANEDAFDDEIYNNATLYVPIGAKQTFLQTTPWNKFHDIQESDFSGIETVSVDNDNQPIEYFNLKGEKVLNPTNGIYIMRQGNKTHKITLP